MASTWVDWHTCKKVEPVVELEYYSTSHQLRKKTKECYVVEDLGAGSFASWHQAVEITPISDLQLGSSAIQTMDRNSYVLEDGANASWVSKINTTEC